LPLSELDWESLKGELRQNILPKEQFAAKALPKDFSICLETGKPYMPVKSVLAAVFTVASGKVMWQVLPLGLTPILCHLRLINSRAKSEELPPSRLDYPSFQACSKE